MTGVCDGLVLKVADYGENDKLLTVLTAEKGRIFITAKGARSVRSKLLPMCRLFTYANFEFYEKNGRRWLSGGSVSDSFFGIDADISGFALASYIVQLAHEITGEGVPCEDILRMTLNTLYAISTRLKPYEQIKSAYEIFAVTVSGFSPDVYECSECGCDESENDWWLDVMNGSLICVDCFGKRQGGAPIPETDSLMTKNIFVPMDNMSVLAWRYVAAADLKRVFSFSLPSESLSVLARATETYVVNHLERSFDTLDFYHAVKE